MTWELLFIQLACIALPVLYGYFAGRAQFNLIETEIYHKWAFVVFMITLLTLVVFFFALVSQEDLCKH